MAHRWKNDLTHADVTPEAVYLNRRQIIAGMAAAGLGSIAGSTAMADDDLKLNTWDEITSYNNFYEFGTDKDDPARHAHRLTTAPWSIEIDGHGRAARHLRPGRDPGRDDPGRAHLSPALRRGLVDGDPLERVRTGRPAGPGGGRRSKRAMSPSKPCCGPDEMPGVRYPVIDWPYVEGLRLDEALHPLTIMATGLYDRAHGEPERRADPAGRAVEIRLQVDQVDGADHADRRGTADRVEQGAAAGIRVLFQRQSRPSTIRAGARPPSGGSAAGCFPGASRH
jgi:sulfoxide reductase catalytic subunit YedY